MLRDTILTFDLAAVALCVVLIMLYMIGRSYPSKTNLVFFHIVFMTMFSALFNFLSVFEGTSGANVPPWLSYVINIAYLLSYNIVNMMFFVYITSVTKRGKYDSAEEIFIALCAVTDIAAILSAPANGFVFTINSDGEYVRGAGMYLVYCIAVLVFVADAVAYLMGRKNLNKTQSVSIFLLLVLSITCAMLQFFIEGLYISQFALALVELIIYVYLQNPFYYMSRFTLCYNERALRESFGNNINAAKPFSAVAFVPDEYDYIVSVFGADVATSVAYELGKLLTHRFGRRKVFNLSGCKFVILTGGGNSDCERMVKRVREFFRSPVTARGNSFMITPRLAVIRYPEFFGAEDDMVSSLEYFLDKERLTNGQIMLTAENVRESQRETKILHVLRRALTEDGFEVYYQPIYGVKEGQFTMAEALLRLKIRDEELGYIGPDEFIPIAERNGMIVDIGGIVLEQVCRFLSGGQAKKLGIQSIEVNLSVVQCTQSDFADSVSEVLKRYGVSGRQISFEVTETASHKSMEPLLKNMSKLIA